MQWLQLKINCTQHIVMQLEELLLEAGAAAITLQDAKDEPLLEPEIGTTPLWQHVQMIGLFDNAIDANAVTDFLKKHWQFSETFNYEWQTIADQNWERSWMDNFHAMRFGKQLWICPSWEKCPDPDGIAISLDPGLAFGTGTHATTALCLQWLDANPPQEQLIIDYGCGSGILAIAAIKLGARCVFAIDNDPQALEATRLNAERNIITSQQLVTEFPSFTPLILADLILANILAKPLIELAPKFSSLIKPQGKIVLSGILENQIAEVIAAYKNDFDIVETTMLEEWVRVVGIKK